MISYHSITSSVGDSGHVKNEIDMCSLSPLPLSAKGRVVP